MCLKAIIASVLILSSLPFGRASDCYNCDNTPDSVIPQIPDWPIEYTTIEKVNYGRNPLATFCLRPVEMVDTVVLHHSETPSDDSPQRINDFHLSRGATDDPWYMIAYSYVINAPYPGEKNPDIRVTQGRPLDIVGAHAGTRFLVSMDSFQKKLWEEGKVTCGKENGEFRPGPKLESKGKISENVTTIGLVVVGNYASFSRLNPKGYPAKRPRFPSKDTQDLVARTSCQLQKKYPRMKNMKWHSQYHTTNYPGTIRQYIGKIKAMARKYGCSIN